MSLDTANANGTRAIIQRLHRIRNRFTNDAADQKIAWLTDLADRDVRSAALLKTLHETLCFLRAFPDNADVLNGAEAMLQSFEDRTAQLNHAQREALCDTGIAGTVTYHAFSFELADWLERRFGLDVSINWKDFQNPERLDEFLVHLLTPIETETFDEGAVSTEQWIKLATGETKRTDLQWLLAQMRSTPSFRRSAESLYDTAEVPLAWTLRDCRGSITRNRADGMKVVYRKRALRKASTAIIREICRPTRGIRRLPPSRARQLIETIVAALAARNREVHATTYANPDEVYLAPLGEGAYVAVIGVTPRHRLAIEGNYGYMLFSNGMPIGYGGISPLYRQGNTGLNVFPEYRGSEAAYLFTAALRVFRSLFGVTRFIANPIQIGRDNPDAIKSGAFWFYYKLGFRPREAAARALAAKEFARLARQRDRRTAPAVLRTLAASDLFLSLPGDHERDFFEEHWPSHCGRLMTQTLAGMNRPTHAQASRRLASRVASDLCVTHGDRWTKAERAGFDRFATLVGLIPDLPRWKPAEKKSLVRMMLAKYAPQERAYVALLRGNDRFMHALSSVCRNSTA